MNSASTPSKYISMMTRNHTNSLHWEDGLYKMIRKVATKIVQNHRFDCFMGAIILTNCICIGLEIQLLLDKSESALVIQSFENCFLAIYIGELLLRWAAYGCAAWKQTWFIFDAVLVFLGTTTTWILIPLMEGSSSIGTKLMEQVLIVRVLRLLRLVRALRMLEQFRNLWRLVQGLLMSVRTMVSTVMLLVFALYVFACVGIELITKDASLMSDPELSHIIETNFGSIPRLMLTLVQFATMDSIASIYSPLIYRNPWLLLYFIPLLLLISVTVMNLVTAALVEDAIASARMDSEMEQVYTRKRLKQLIPEIKQVFRVLDVSGDGTIGLDELVERITAMIQENQLKMPKEVSNILDPDKMGDFEAIFDFLDCDGSKTISEDEFVEGVCTLAFTHVPLETTQMLTMLKQQRMRFDILVEQVQDGFAALRPASGAAAASAPMAVDLSTGFVGVAV